MKPSKTPKRSAAVSPVRLSIGNPESLLWEVQQVQLEVARRAYELFELRGCEHGHDWEDWFRAESELLRPVSVVVSENDDRVSVRANVTGFGKTELKVALEPRRLIVLGKKSGTTEETERGDLDSAGSYPVHLICMVDLPAEVLVKDSVVDFEAGLLRCELPKAALASQSAAAGA
jgi:HSP20 family molecular chaperone IbpA